MVNIDPLDFTILLNNNIVDYNDLVVNAHVNYLSVIHAVRRDVELAPLFFPLVFVRDNQAPGAKHDLSTLPALPSVQSSLRNSTHLLRLPVRSALASLSL